MLKFQKFKIAVEQDICKFFSAKKVIYHLPRYDFIVLKNIFHYLCRLFSFNNTDKDEE